MDLNSFIVELKQIYKKYPAFLDVLNKSTDDYKMFLYLHLSENIGLKISNKDFDNDLIRVVKKVTIEPKKNYCDSLLKIYSRQINESERQIIEKNKPFNVYFFYEKYPEKNTDEYYYYKNRRDFLTPCFLNHNTIEFLERVNINDFESYKKLNKLFFITLGKLRKYIKTKERLGVMVDGSATLSIHNVRLMKDLDLVLFHPRFYEPKIQEDLTLYLHKQMPFIDAYFHDFLSWEGEEKPVVDSQVKYITKGKVTDFFYVPFDPQFHYYFFGIKVVLLDYNLKYRAMRHYPKNIADLIITKHKLGIDVPKIPKMGPQVNAYNEKMYTREEFVRMMLRYMKKFKFKLPNMDIEKEIAEITE